MSDEEQVRLDRWLWAARFFKTRGLATEAINGGKVHLNGQRTKPGKTVRIGNHLSISKGQMEWEVEVKGIALQRRPAKEAVLLYEETAESLSKRTAMTELQQQARLASPQPTGRPNKRDRRRMDKFIQRDS